VPLERQSIEKKDFPIGRRGYDPDAVDAHLGKLADEVEELKLASRRRSETLASMASDQVRSIVEAAEGSAAEIQRQAEDEARDIRSEAAEEAQSTREQATSHAREYVGKVSESTSVMLERLDAMETELSTLIESLRTGSNRLGADLQLLEENLVDVRSAVEPRPRFEIEQEAAAASSGTFGDRGSEAISEWEVNDVVEAELVEAEPADGESAATSEDETEGARLIALNMALNGTPREETDKYLSENFAIGNRAQLLDEVYASVES
jgi:DivIVA domain-containing protein